MEAAIHESVVALGAVFLAVGLSAISHQGFGGTTDVRCAIVQFGYQQAHAVGVDDDRLEGFVRTAAGQGARIVVAPETCLYRYAPWEQSGVTMLDLAGAFGRLKTRFANLANELNICIVIGLREPSGDGNKPVYNTALFFGPDGALLGRHRKMVPSNAEKSWTKAGSESNGDATPFETPYGRVGTLICKDMDSNTWPDRIVAKGIDLFIGVNGDPYRGWVKVVHGCKQARCYGIGANKYGNSCDGNSGFVDPNGTVLSQAGQGEKILYQTLPLPATRTARSAWRTSTPAWTGC